MRRWLLPVLPLGILGVVAACNPFGSDPPATEPEIETDDGGAYIDPGGFNTTGKGAGSGANTGLPCDVQQLLENRCVGCHLDTSTLPLLSHADLVKPSKSEPTKTTAMVAIERMQSTSKPMPPPPAEPPAADEIAVLQNWVGHNQPEGKACTPPPVADAGADAAPDTTNYNTPLTCTSKKTWIIQKTTIGKGGRGPGGIFGGGRDRDDDDDVNASATMAPGRTCLNCHQKNGGPAYKVAGTVYPTAKEVDDCYGVNGGMDVIVTDANGVETTAPVNSAGNFFIRTAIAAPYRVKIKAGAKERVMKGAATAGDCNACHTATGANGAPGRVMAP